jgi:hypothetical protein
VGKSGTHPTLRAPLYGGDLASSAIHSQSTLNSQLILYLIDPLLLLGFSVLLVAVSLTALLVAAFPAIQDLSRAARSAEKLFDRLDRELPPTLEAIRLTGLELSDLSEEVSQGVQSATAVARNVDSSLAEVKKQAGTVRTSTYGVFVGVKAAWRTWRQQGDSVEITADRDSRKSAYYLEESADEAD